MKLTKIITVLFITKLLFSCVSENETSILESNEIVEIQEIDSTAFYDSIYEPYKYSIDTFFLNKHKIKEFYGAVLIAEKGRIVFQNSYGYANLKTKDTLTLEHTFQLASASKPFTAIAMMQLVEKGKVKLTDDVKKYISNFPYEGINIHQLLCHRSGLSQYTHFCDAPDSVWSDKHQTITNNDVLNIMEKYVPMVNYAPNQTHYYCNTNYMLLASIIEKVSGLSFKDYLKKHIFDPSDMKSTVLYHRDNADELIMPAQGYNGAFNPVIDIYLNGVVGDKGIYSNVHDLLAFDKALYENKLVADSTIQLIMQDHNELQNNVQNYGYGFRIFPESEMGRIVFHTGWWKGFRTYFIRIPEKQKTVIVLSNIKRGKFFDVRELAKLSRLN